MTAATLLLLLRRNGLMAPCVAVARAAGGYFGESADVGIDAATTSASAG